MTISVEKSFIACNDEFVDYSSIVDENDQRLSGFGSDPVKILTFPAQLHYILSELEKDGMNNIMSWQPHGRCFAISKPQELAEKVLPW